MEDEARDPGTTGDEEVGPNATDSERRGSGPRRLFDGTRIKAAGTLVGSLLTTLVLLHEAGGTVGNIVQPVFGGDPREEIQAVVQAHYEAVGERDLEKALGFFGPVEGDDVFDREALIEEQTTEHKFCPIQDARVEDVMVPPDIDEGGAAVATADVHFDHKCGPSDWRFTWKVSKVDGEWKLGSLEDKYATSTPVPFTFLNEGATESVVGGEGSATRPTTVKTSATASGAQDGSENWVTYDPAKVVDDRPETAWQAALEDDDLVYHKATGGGSDAAWRVSFEEGKEPWVLLEYDAPVTVSRVGIIPGYSKTDPADGTDRFYQTYAVRKARIEFSDGSSTEVDFEQDPEMKFVDVPDTETTFVRVEILDTHPPRLKSPGGIRYNDVFGKLAISEIEVETS